MALLVVSSVLSLVALVYGESDYWPFHPGEAEASIVHPDPLQLQAIVDNTGHIAADASTQLSYLDVTTGELLNTSNSTEPRPTLSTSKLLIADYVLTHGTEEEKADALTMVQNSSDSIATSLIRTYPKAIGATAEKYHLPHTWGTTQWGRARTTTDDLVSFISQKLTANPNDPLLEAMRAATPIAADGYSQDFGTYTLPGVTGTKWGWSNDRKSTHASVSFGTVAGHTFVVAAITYGTKEEHTAAVRQAIIQA